MRIDLAILIAAVLLLAVLAYGRQATERRSPPSTFSTYDSGPNGYRALFEVLRRGHLPVRRFERALGLLDPKIRTLVISGYENDPAAKPLDRGDAARLRRFVAQGGRLVVLDAAFAGADDATPAAPVTVAARAHGAIALARNRFTAGVGRIRVPIPAVFAFDTRNGVPLLANRRGLAAIAYPYGKGEVVAISAPALFGNAYLGRADNLRFAYDALAGHGAIAFDEYVHGYEDGLGLWAVLPPPVRAALFLIVAIVVLALIGANMRFAPPIAIDAREERDSSAYLDAMVALMRRAHAARAAVAVFADAARARCSSHEAARSTGVELETLKNIANPSDAVLLRAARLDFRLRKELHDSARP